MTKEEEIVGFLRSCATIAETRFAMALIGVCSVEGLDSNGLSLSHDGEFGYLEVSLRCQVQLLPGTRSDFAVYDGGSCVAVIEIGDPTHWRDESKADADRMRDLRVLAEHGVHTVRVTNARAMAMDVDAVSLLLRHVSQLGARHQDLWTSGWRAATENCRIEAQKAAELCGETTGGAETTETIQ